MKSSSLVRSAAAAMRLSNSVSGFSMVGALSGSGWWNTHSRQGTPATLYYATATAGQEITHA